MRPCSAISREFFHVRFAGVGRDPRVGRPHQSAERRKIGSRHLYARGLDLPDLLRLVIGNQLAHEIAGCGAFLPENHLLGGIELLPGRRAHCINHVVVDMPCDCQMLLHFVELIEVDHRDRVLLAVHDFLRQRQVELRKCNRLNDCAKRLQRGLDLQFRRRAQFQAFDVIGRIDRAYAVGDVAEAVFPVAQQDETLCLRERREPVHRRTVKHAKGVLRAVENEGQHDGGERNVVFVELALRGQPHVDGAELDLLRLLRRTAKHIIGEDVDLDRAAGARVDAACKLLGGNVRRVILLGKMCKPQGHRRGPGRRVWFRQRQGRSSDACPEESPTVHDILPLMFHTRKAKYRGSASANQGMNATTSRPTSTMIR